jgi:hypothetical protein
MLMCASSGVTLLAQAAEGPAATAYEITIPENPEDPLYYRELISGFVRVELEEAGLRTLTAQASATALSERKAVTAEQEPPALEELLQWAGAAGADLLALSRFSTHEEQIRIDFAWYDVAARAPIAVCSCSQAMDLSFDRIIQQGVDSLLLEAQPWLARLSMRPQPASPALPVKPVASGGAPGGMRQASARWELGAGTGPFLAVGRASDYFKLGFLPSIFGTFRLGRPESPWKIGLFGAACWFRASGTGDQGSAVLAPLGPELRFAPGGERPPAVFLRLSGGPAVFNLKPENQAAKTKLIAFLLAGMGLELPLGARLALALEPAFLVFFEPQAPIMGFAPSGSIYVRW